MKMISEMNVTETSLPQDGRFEMKVDEKQKSYDIRVSAVPVVLGESVVVRIMDRSVGLVALDHTGMCDDDLAKLRHLMSQPMGMIVITGPVGAGKTTTAYGMLTEIARSEIKVMTIEDPVEYLIPGISQCHVHRTAGFTFQAALRSFLRHDPDVIFAGAIRNQETAEICAEAALTGHVVITTMVPKDAVSVIQRLADMDLPRYLVAAMLIGSIAQRLIRKVCPFCKEKGLSSISPWSS